MYYSIMTNWKKTFSLFLKQRKVYTSAWDVIYHTDTEYDSKEYRVAMKTIVTVGEELKKLQRQYKLEQNARDLQ